MKHPQIRTLTVIILSLFVLSTCAQKASQTEGEGEEASEARDKEPVELVYVDWASELASAHVVKTVIEERLDRSCKLLPVTLIAMWEAIAIGDKDGMVAGWLPSLQSRFLEKHRSQVVDLGPNLEGTKIGLVVPEYVSIDSIGELKEHRESFNHKIIGIDPHAGIMETTEEAMEAYGLSNYSLVSGSGPTMTTALGNAIEEDRWIVVTGWTPHWKFAEWDLKYLEDPKKVYGDAERIHTVVREGLKKDMPEVYAFLDAFYWKPEHMQKVMLMATDPETSYEEAARQWVRENEELVDGWLDERSGD